MEEPEPVIETPKADTFMAAPVKAADEITRIMPTPK